MSMGVLRNPYKGVRHDRYQFMLDNMPEETRRMDEAGETDEYLRQVERRYQERWAELTEALATRKGARPGTNVTDWAWWTRTWAEAKEQAREVAYHEVIEAL